MMKRIRRLLVTVAGVVAFLVVAIFVYRTIAFRIGSGQELVAVCAPGAAESEAFEIEGSFSNEFYLPPDSPAWCSGGRPGGRSTGSGSGTIGDFEYEAEWCMSDAVLRAEGETLATDDGEIFLNEETRTLGSPSSLEAMLRTRLGPPLEFEGVFTITGGTGRYEGATGVANVVARQLGGGRTAMAACGVISYD